MKEFWEVGCNDWFKWHGFTLSSDDPSDLVLCPVRALEIYLDKRSSFTRDDNDNMLWTLRQSQLSKVFIDLVTEALMASGSHRNNISIGPHQGRKFAASLSKFYLKCSDDELAMDGL